MHTQKGLIDDLVAEGNVTINDIGRISAVLLALSEESSNTEEVIWHLSMAWQVFTQERSSTIEILNTLIIMVGTAAL